MNRTRLMIAACICAIAGITAAVAQAAPGDTLGVSTLVQRIFPAGGSGYNTLIAGAGEPYIVRDGSTDAGTSGLTPLGVANPGRETRRTSLAYFGQLTDFQLADEESPARVEFLDPQGGAFSAAWRPGEALNPQEENAMIEQMNSFAKNAPENNGDGSKPAMDFVINTGDIADSQQANEVLWNRQLMEGEMVNPGSGVAPPPPGTDPLCPVGLTIHDAADPSKYTGVQDPSDWPLGIEGYFYNPDNPLAYPPAPGKKTPYSDAKAYPGLMDRAQQPFQATGLDVPGYVVFGNHDGLVQGNAWASQLFNELSMGCLKPVNDAEANSGMNNDLLFGLVTDPTLTRAQFIQIYNDHPELFTGVPPDPGRHLVNKKEFKNIFGANGKDNGHGFGFVDPAQDSASKGSAGYYSWVPKRGVKYITLDTHSEGGRILTSDNGNLDTPQFNWLESELKEAVTDNQVVIIFSHHAVTSLNADVPDEEAPQCADVDPTLVIGCDADPRDSTPIMLTDDVKNMVLKYPNVVAWVAGHSHVNKVTPYKNPAGDGGFWSIRTAALADWPKQNRLLQIFDDRDGNLSLFGTLIDQASPVPTPAAGTAASSMTNDQLASISRELGYNDNQTGGTKCSPNPCGEGTPDDRNVELLVKDPRRPEAYISKLKVQPKKKNLKAGKKIKLKVKVTNTGTLAAKNVKVKLKSSNKRVKVKKSVVIKNIGIEKTATVKVTVRAKGKARGKAKITVSTNGLKAASKLKIKPKKKHHKKKHKKN